MRVKRFAACAAALMLAQACPPAAFAEPAEAAGSAAAGGYAAFLAAADLPRAEGSLTIDAGELARAAGKVTDTDGAVLLARGEKATVVLSGKPGLYTLAFEYDPTEESARDIELSLELDGALPFKEAGHVVLPRRFRDKGGRIGTDENGNDIRPSQEPVPFAEAGWLSAQAEDGAGYVSGALLFPVQEGTALTLCALTQGVRLRRLVLAAPEETPSYAEYAAVHAGIPDAARSLPVIEAELPAWKTDTTLVAAADRSSPVTTPQKGSKISLNMISGANWKTVGSTLAWTFTPAETGMYVLRLRCRQNYSQGFYAVRSLQIDGKTPFREAAALRFTYRRGWTQTTLADDKGRAYKFYFEKGHTYTLSLTAALGELGEILEDTAIRMAALNDIYRQLLMILSASPDLYRDYNLDEVIPGTLSQMAEEAGRLESIAGRITAVSGAAGSDLATLTKTALQLRQFHDDPDQIAKRFSEYKDNLAALNTWMVELANRPLDLDAITVAAPGEPVPKAEAGFFARLWYGIRRFAASFAEDYNSLGSGGTAGETITVWTTAGRDQAAVYSEMMRSQYAQASRESLGRPIGVRLQLVSGDAVLPSLAAEVGPDVLLGVTGAAAIDYALRQVTVDLNTLESEAGMRDVLSRFRDSAAAPFRLEGGLYALPEQQATQVLFYRSDILRELEIPAPTTEAPWSWDDLIRYLPTLQAGNMSILMETGANANTSGLGTFAMLLFQNGGAFYEGDGRATALDSETAVNTFTFWTDLYTSYGMPSIFNAANRFRTGESPVVIADFTLYNTLAVSAPEIKGLWEMAPVPGTTREDGSLSCASCSTSTGAVMFSGAAKREAAWDFLKWWTSAEAQDTFAREMESLMGASARYPSANREAFSRLAWSPEELEVLRFQLDRSQAVPEVAGGYYLSRYVSNAFRNVSRMEPREALLTCAQIVDDEILAKRKEFSLPVG